jgi:NAD(P)-dependent dehydrogenase (short-subunit alcohol dehydrogenase family)
MRLGSGAVAVVTGGAAGIGHALVELLLERGAEVVVVDSEPGGLHALLEARPGATGHVADVSQLDAIRGIAATVRDRLGRVDLLVNNAGVSVAGHFEDIPVEDLRRVMDVNFWGTVFSCRAFLPLLRIAAEGGGAVICNVLSDFALLGVPGKSGYAASKFATRALSEVLGAELQGSGVSVLAAYPGATATGLVRRGRAVDAAKQETEARYLDRAMRPEYVAHRILRGIERGRSKLLIGWDVRAIDLATRIAPGLTQWALRRYWRHVPFL